MTTNAEIRASELLLKGVISEMPKKQRQQVADVAQRLRHIIHQHGDIGVIALSLVSCDYFKEN